MRGNIANHWHATDEKGKLEMLQRAFDTNCPVDVELLDENIGVMDTLAKEIGLVGCYVATVDAAGLSCRTPAVVSPQDASKYRSRRLES
jgi:hypothetical protein